MFYLIRHGEPDYSNDGTKVFRGFGINFAPLTTTGINQIKEIALDSRLSGCDIIVTSPYTRTMQTAAILSRALDIDMVVEPNIFEWYGDKDHKLMYHEIPSHWIEEFNQYNGDYPENEVKQWENNEQLRERLLSTLSKYNKYKKVIVVCHGMVIHSICKERWLEHGEILEYEYE